MKDLVAWSRVWEQADAVSLFYGTLLRWSDERARDLYMRALIPSWEGSYK